MKLSLYKKGLCVISLILVVQLGFLALFAAMLAHTENIAEQESLNRSIVGRCNWIGVLLLAANLSAFSQRLTGEKQFLDIYRSVKQSAEEQISGLRAEFGPDTAQVKRVDAAAKQTAGLWRALESSEPNDSGDGSKDGENARATFRTDNHLINEELLPIWKRLFAIRHGVLHSELAGYSQDPLFKLPARRAARNLFIAALLLVDVLGAVFVFYLFTLGLTKRLDVLSKNTARFARKEPLLERVSGTDEIADLDRVFHDMAASLTEAERRKQEFLAMISHDLRTPLTSAQTSLEFVGEGHSGTLPEEAQKWVASARTNIHTVLRLINELLEIERIESGMLNLSHEEIEVKELVFDAVDSVRAIAAQKQITIETAVPTIYLVADFDRLERVLVNLLGNAVKFSPEKSTITVAALEREAVVEFSVIDRGRGIPREFIDRVFERYQQVTAEDARKLGGSGLGLAISKAIVEAHGGSIAVESSEGAGTTLRFEIPKKQCTEVSSESKT